MEKEAEQQVDQMRKQVRRQLFVRMSLLAELETVDFRRENIARITSPLQIDRNDSSLERLLGCPRLKEFMYDWGESESETYFWIRTHWQGIKVNRLPDSEDGCEYEHRVEDGGDFDEDGVDFDEYGSGDDYPTLHDQMRLQVAYDSEDSEDYNLRTYDYW